MRYGSVGLAMALGLLLAATPVLAAEGTLTAKAQLPLAIQGENSISAADASFLLEGDEGRATVDILGRSGEALRVIHRAWGVVSDDPDAKVFWRDHVDTKPLAMDGGRITVDERRDGFRLLAYDSPLSLTGSPNGLLVGALDHARPVSYVVLEDQLSVELFPGDDSDRFEHVLSAGDFEGRSLAGELSADGPVSAFVDDAVVTYVSPEGVTQKIQAHFRVDEHAKHGIYDPIEDKWFGPGEHTEYIQEYLLVKIDGTLAATFNGLPATLYAARPHIDVLGQATLPKATGRLTVTDEDGTHVHDLSGQDLKLAGAFSLRPHDAQLRPDRSAGTTTPVEGDGDFTYVSYGAVAQSYDWTKAITAVGLGALILAALAWTLKALAGAGAAAPAVAGYARVSGDEVLEHPGRHEVYERVKSFPGVSFIQLSDQVSFGASTLNYHLRVLERNGYITSVKDGRYLRFFDRQSGLYAGAKKDAVSALRNPNTAAIAKHILQNPGVPQCDLAEKFGITASTVNWHINRLATAGLVDRQRDAHYTRYYVGEAWASLPADEQARFATPLPLVIA